MKFHVRRILPGVLCAAAAAASLGVGAQQVYRIVGPDGRVTFSDRPPQENAAAARPAPTVAIPAGQAPAATAAAATGGLPFELRNTANRYPVTLYTGTDCAPCASGRAFLSSRGIPFTEKTVASNEDIEALKRISGGARVPFLTIGGQQLNGFSEPEWSQFLDAAGYPRASRLPSGYRNPAPAPLVAVQQPAARPAEAQEQAQPPQAQLPPVQAPANPAGIRF